MVINNPIEFQMVMNTRLVKVMQGVMTRILMELGNIIDEEVYSYSLDGAWQNRTGEFKQSWDFSVPIMVGGWCESVLSQDAFGHYTPNNNRGEWSHGNGWSSLFGFDSLNEIINNGLNQSNFNFPAIEARPFWSVFLQWLDLNINEIFREQCLKNDIPVEMASVFYTFN